MRKKLISILIANVLFLTNAGFTSLAVEQNIDESITASSTEVTAEAAVETDEGESQEGDGSDLYFDDVEYVKIQSFTELPEEVKNQQLKQGGKLEELYFPESLEVSVVADIGRDDRIREQLGRERELMREAEREALEAEEKDKASAEDTEKEPEEEIEEEEDSSLIIDGEKIIFFESDSEAAIEQTTVESGSENSGQTDEQVEGTSSDVTYIDGGSNANVSTGASVVEPATSESTNTASEPVTQEQSSSNESTDTSSVVTTETPVEEPVEIPAEEPAETPSDAGNEGSGEESTSSEDLVGRIISIFRPLMVHAAEEVQEPIEEKEEETVEHAVEEEKEDAPENEDASNAGNSGDGEDAAKGNPAETPADNEEYVEETENEQIESIELVSGIEWVLDPSRSDADPFSSEEIGKKFVFVPVLVIPDYYYIEAELPTITVDIVEDYFAFDKAVDVDGVKIRVRADKGVFPEGAFLTAQKLSYEDEIKVNEVVEEQVSSASVAKTYTFDITIFDKEGIEIEPDTEKGRVLVSFEAEEILDEDLHAEVYHIVDTNDKEANKDVQDSGLGDNILYNDSAVLAAEELKAAIIEGDNGQAIEVETNGFSTYVLIFKQGSENYQISKSAVSVDEILRSLNVNGSVTNAHIDTSFCDYVIAANIACTSSNDVQPNSYGLYDESGVKKWFIITKRPFYEEISLTVDYDDEDNLPQTKTITINCVKENEVSIDNNEYPYATLMSGTQFLMKVKAGENSAENFYQWQSSLDNSTWVDIPKANFDFYGDNSDTNIGKWFRCVVNGKESKSVRLLRKNGDPDGRTWMVSNDNLWYLSNDSVAYSIYNNGTCMVFDVLYYDADTNSMLNTTSDNNGWKVYSGKSTSTTPAFNLDELFFSFDETNLIVQADLKSECNKFAIGGNCCLGNSIDGTLYANSGDDGISKVSYMAIASLQEAIDELQYGIADQLAMTITPDIAADYVWIGAQGPKAPVPYKTNVGRTLLEGENPALAMSWVDTESGGIVKFNFSFGTIEDVNAVEERNKIGVFSYDKGSSVKTNIKGASLSGDTLTQFAESEGEYTDKIVVDMTMTPMPSIDSDVAKAIATKANKTLTSYASDPSVHSTSSKTVYVVDWVDIEVNETKNNNDPDNIPELPNAVTLAIDYDFTDKSDLSIYRYHNSKAESFSMSSSAEDLKYSTNSSAGKIYLSARKFSTYAFVYKAPIYNTVTFFDGSTQLFTDKVKPGAKVKKPSNLDGKDGKAFVGWSTSQSGTPLYNFDTSVNSDLKLYAVYKKTYKVTFNDGTKTWSTSVIEGEKVAKPSPDPTKVGYTFKGWYPKLSTSNLTDGSNSSTNSTKTTTTGAPYNFDKEVKADLDLVAGWVDNNANTGLDASKAAAMADSDNESRAPKTGDDLPVVWLWVLLLVAGVTTFTVSAREIANAGKNPEQPKKRSKLQVYLLLAGIIIKTTFNFIVRKIRENKAKVLLGLSTAVILVSCIVLASTFLQYHKAESLYSDADVTYVETSEDEEVDEYVEEIKELAGEEPKFDWWDCAQVNLKELKAEYPEVVGWIYFENENISYPIMYSGDNAKYLKTAYTGEKAKAGAIFIDGESTPDFTDPHSLIYGHNMRDLSMFGRLRYYMTTPDYYQDHQYFQIFTEDKVYRYQIFAYEEVADNHDVFWVFGKEPTGYYKMLKEIEQGSYCNSGITTNESDHVITLATCTDKDNERLIVSAVRTDEYDYVQ
ncbi:MAG: sortase [Butyrivibrio sp.]|nr:sortase [Butyrivibrio sp.]